MLLVHSLAISRRFSKSDEAAIFRSRELGPLLFVAHVYLLGPSDFSRDEHLFGPLIVDCLSIPITSANVRRRAMRRKPVLSAQHSACSAFTGLFFGNEPAGISQSWKVSTRPSLCAGRGYANRFRQRASGVEFMSVKALFCPSRRTAYRAWRRVVTYGIKE